MMTKNVLQNQNGMTLVELMVATAASTLIILGGAMLLSSILEADAFTRRSADTLETAQSLEMNIPHYVGQAINARWTDIDITNIGGGPGEIRTFRSSRDAAIATPPTTVAAFIREAGYTSSTNPGSDLRATSLYFKNPTATTPGILFVSSSNPGTGTTTLSSRNAEMFFDNIVEFELSSGGIPIDAGDTVRMVEMRVVFRKFRSSEPSEWRWCPSIEMNTTAECRSGAQYTDITKLINIPLRNNVMISNFESETGSRLEETVYGDVYYYRAGGGGQ